MTLTTARAAWRAAGVKVTIQFLYRDRGARHSAVTRRACGRVRARAHSDTARIGHDTAREGATTHPRARHDTAPSARYARGLGAMRA